MMLGKVGACKGGCSILHVEAGKLGCWSILSVEAE